VEPFFGTSCLVTGCAGAGAGAGAGVGVEGIVLTADPKVEWAEYIGFIGGLMKLSEVILNNLLTTK